MYGLNEIRSMNAVKGTGLGASTTYLAQQEHAKRCEQRLKDRDKSKRPQKRSK